MKSEIVVIGASAGGINPLKTIVEGLPASFQAAIFVVIHVGEGIGPTGFPQVLQMIGPLPTSDAEDGEPIVPGRIYIAKPDFHLTLEPGRVRVRYGPRENLTRPAINPLFRSAADAYGPRVTGVILSGWLDDGVAGLASIKERGGLAIVQDPATAACPEMPRAALQYIRADYILPPNEISDVLAQVASTRREIPQEVSVPMTRELIRITCPDCRGPLWVEKRGDLGEYRCRVGHAFSPRVLAQEHITTVERSLWAAIVALEESADIAESVSGERVAEGLESARQRREEAARLRDVLRRLSDKPISRT